MADAPDSFRTPRRALRVEVIARDGPAARLASGLGRWLVRVAPPGAAGEVTIVLVSDSRIRALNRRYRRTDRVTDVLSFATPSPESRRLRSSSFGAPAGALAEAGVPSPWFLGDIVIATGRARRQAREAGHALATELRILALHGFLHLLGFNHERNAGRMARVERRLRRKGGLREGLIERARSGPRRTP